MSNISNPQTTSGGKNQTASSDADSQDLLEKILKELKKVNIYLSSMTNIEVQDDDIGENE